MIGHMEIGEGLVPTFEDVRSLVDAHEALMEFSGDGPWARAFT